MLTKFKQKIKKCFCVDFQLENVVSLYLEAEKYHCVQLLEYCLWFLGVHYAKLKNTPEFQLLPASAKEEAELFHTNPAQIVAKKKNCQIQ